MGKRLKPKETGLRGQLRPRYYVQQFNVDSPSVQEGINYQVDKGYKPIFFQVYSEWGQGSPKAVYVNSSFLLVIFERASNEKERAE